jgi:hypothetical protein
VDDDKANENAHLTGVYQVTIGEEAYPLKRTAGALRAINLMAGGLQNNNPNVSTVVTRVLGRDLETIGAVMRAGCGVAPNAFSKLEEQVFNAGVDDVVPKICDFIFLLRSRPGTPIPYSKAETEEQERLAKEGGKTEEKADPTRSPSLSESTQTN